MKALVSLFFTKFLEKLPDYASNLFGFLKLKYNQKFKKIKTSKTIDKIKEAKTIDEKIKEMDNLS